MRKLTQILVPIFILNILGGTIFITIRMIFWQESPAVEESCGKPIFSGCSVFSISKGDQVFFGGNDDYINPDSYYWVDPGDGQNY
ncbi:MAG TPA: hypothetical protein VLM83_08400, partial [Anaerolineales bacterium]|nr:hypothetical protein [Anaerolineales bacterium]